jgi:hypothetical protein
MPVSRTPWADLLAPYFAAFDRTLDSSHISAALDLVDTDSRDAKADKTVHVLHGWLWFLAELHRRIDPAWDPHDPPAHGVAPPPGHGPVRPTGDVDPESIADPIERASYVAQLRAARTRVARYQAQAALRQIGRVAVRLFSDFVDRHDVGSELDRWRASSAIDTAWLTRAALGEAPPDW